MLSIITVFSSDRLKQLTQQENYMIRYEDWRNCERIIVLDGDVMPTTRATKVIKYERNGKHFNFKLAWDMGVKAASNKNLLLVDSDRLFDKTFLMAAKNIADYQISYPKRLINLMEELDDIETIDNCKKIKGEPISHRYARQSSRDPASGHMALTLITYNHINREIDEHQLSYGYTDYDFTETARRAKIAFKPIDSVSIHIKHGYSLQSHVFTSLNLKNGIAHYKKFKLPLPLHLANYIKKHDLDISLIEEMTFEDVMAGKLHEGAKRKSI